MHHKKLCLSSSEEYTHCSWGPLPLECDLLALSLSLDKSAMASSDSLIDFTPSTSCATHNSKNHHSQDVFFLSFSFTFSLFILCDFHIMYLDTIHFLVPSRNPLPLKSPKIKQNLRERKEKRGGELKFHHESCSVAQ